jgi:hypothetical protein
MADRTLLTGEPSSSPPLDLLDPPDVDGLVAWIRGEDPRQHAAAVPDADRAAALSRRQLATRLRQRGRSDAEAAVILGPEEDWTPLLHPRIRSHRGAAGRLIVWCKRRVIGPLIRWHVEFTEENVRRQAYVDRSLLALVEHLGARVVVLEGELADLKRHAGGGDAPAPRDPR